MDFIDEHRRTHGGRADLQGAAGRAPPFAIDDLSRFGNVELFSNGGIACLALTPAAKSSKRRSLTTARRHDQHGGAPIAESAHEIYVRFSRE
jgi:hypothetical protein